MGFFPWNLKLWPHRVSESASALALTLVSMLEDGYNTDAWCGLYKYKLMWAITSINDDWSVWPGPSFNGMLKISINNQKVIVWTLFWQAVLITPAGHSQLSFQVSSHVFPSNRRNTYCTDVVFSMRLGRNRRSWGRPLFHKTELSQQQDTFCWDQRLKMKMHIKVLTGAKVKIKTKLSEFTYWV